MADYDPKITKLLEERCTGYASEMTTAKDIAKLTGLDLDVARAFSRGWSRMRPHEIRGYKKDIRGNKLTDNK
jgi:hypothetical protein